MPNWYGIEGINFEWLGTQSDPRLHYKGDMAVTILGMVSTILGAAWVFVYLGMLMGW